MKEAYIYTYVNKETKKTYIGARCAYVGSCYDDFNIKYFSSSKDKEFLKDMADGKLEGQIVLVMNDDNADKKIFEVESKMIKAYWDKYGKENSYNHYANGKWSTAGMHPNVGKHLTEETKAKIGAASKGRILSKEARKKIGAASKGRHPSEETKAKISAANKGKHHTEEAIAKMRANHADVSGINNPNYGCHKLAGENNPMYGKRGILSPNFGKHISEEAKAIISAKAKCRKVSDEARKKMSIAHKGRVMSEEEKIKRSESLKGMIKAKFRYLTESGDIVMMDKNNAGRWHPDWVKID